MSWETFWGVASSGGGGTDPADKARISALENTVYEYEIFESLGSGASGTLTPPTGATIVLNQYPGAGDCLISRLDGTTGKPIDEAVLTTGGLPVVGTLTVGGAWTLSGIPSSYPVGLIYQIQIAAINRQYLDNEKLVNVTALDQKVYVQNVDPGMASPGLWIQTGLGAGTDMTFWVEDGL